MLESRATVDSAALRLRIALDSVVAPDVSAITLVSAGSGIEG